jgi:ferredoxin
MAGGGSGEASRGQHDVRRITLSPSGDIISSHPDETVLAAILRAGASIRFGCRGGGCGACKVRVLSGSVDHGRCSSAALTEEEKAAGWTLSCQARARGDLRIEVTAANRYRVPAWWPRPTPSDP